MSLQFVYGRAHSGKTQYVLEIAKKLMSDNKPVIIVVPEQFTHLAEKRFINKVGSIEQGKAEILSFDRIAKRINTEFPSFKKQLTAVGKSLIISEILSTSELEYYTNSANQSGFVEICVNEISEMKKYNITPDVLSDAIKRIDDNSLRMKLNDLLKIYTAYENSVNTVYSDSDDSLSILNDNLIAHRPYKNHTFLFDEFSSFNPQERNIIASLSLQCENIFITFCADPDEGEYSVFRPVIGSAEAIKKVCADAGCSVSEPVILSNSFYANKEMCLLERYLFTNTSISFDDECKNIKIFSSENPYSEVMRVASQIVSLVREKNVRFRDIGVVCPDISAYSHIFRSVFEQFNIPYFVDEKSKVLDHAVVNFVINILDVYINGYNAETVVNFLKSGYVCSDKEAIYAADNFIVATNATKNTWLSDEKWKKTLEVYTKGDTELTGKLELIRNSYILPLSKLHEQIKGKNTVLNITRSLYTYLIESGFCSTVEAYINHFKSENNSSMAKQYESVWKILMEAFDMLVYILGNKKVNIRQYRSHLFTAFGQQKIGIIPTSLDEIIIGDVLRSKSEYVIYQFVLGVNDGNFPGSQSDNGMMTDKDKEFLTESGLEYSPDTKEKAYFDRFLIYSLFTHPMQSLIISYPLSDSSFSSLRSAFVITTLKSMFKKLTESSSISDDFNIFLASNDSAEEFLAISAGALCENRNVDPRWQDVYKYFTEKHPERIEKINKLIYDNAPVSRLSSEITEKLFNDEFYSTVSRIQRYNSCRYSYYLEYMLRLKEKKVYGLEATDIGTLIHEIIEKILAEITETGRQFESIGEKYFESRVEAYLNKYIDDMSESGGEVTEREIYSVRRYKDAIVASLMLIRTHIAASEFKPIGHEIVFDDDNIGCIEMKLDNGKTLKITGKIDRADSFENENGSFIRVIDYKTGKKIFDYSDVYYGIDVQLLVYLDALVNKTDRAHHAGALYLQIKSPVASFDTYPDEVIIPDELAKVSTMTGIIADDSNVLAAYDSRTAKISNKATLTQFRLLGDYVKSTICSNANALSDGEIQINPYFKSDPDGEPDSCGYCPYSTICNRASVNNRQFRYLEKINKKEIWNILKKLKEVDEIEVDPGTK